MAREQGHEVGRWVWVSFMVVAVLVSPLPAAFSPIRGATGFVTSVSSAGSTAGWIQTNLNFSGFTTFGTAYDPANQDLYLLSQLNEPGPWGGLVAVFSGLSYARIAQIPMHQYPAGPVFDTLNQEMYVASTSLSGQLLAIDSASNQVVGNITTIPSYPEPPILDTATGNLYVGWAQVFTYGLTIVSGSENRIVGNLSLSAFPLGGVFDPLNGDLYLSSFSPNEVVVVSGASQSVVSTLDLSGQPGQPMFDPQNDEIYLPIGSLDEILGISSETNQVVSTILVGTSPATPVLDPANGLLYVSNSGSNNISVISGSSNSVVATIPSVPSPHGILFDPRTQYLYVSSWTGNYSGELCVISGVDTTDGFVSLGADPDLTILDNATGDLLVSDTLSGGTRAAVTVVGVNDSGLAPASCEPPPSTTPAPSLIPLAFVGVILALPIAAVIVSVVGSRRNRRQVRE